MSDDNVTLTIHGLAADNGRVRADVFLEKFRALVNILKIADLSLNSRKSHNLIIEELSVSSARAMLREKVSVKKCVPDKGAPLVADLIGAIYAGEKHLDRFPEKLIESIAPLSKVSKNFSHGEIEFGGNNIVRIDEYLANQTKRAIDRLRGVDDEKDKNFEGVAYGVFDGVLKELDSRGILVQGKLVLTAGSKEIECIFKRDDIPELRNNFDRRARVEGIAHYDGAELLPVRLDVKKIVPVKEDADLTRWRGALSQKRVKKPEGFGG
jgi:hypothetical protein